MSVRVSESWTTRGGHRRTVSAGLGTYVLGSLAACFGRGLLGLLALPFVLTWWVLLAELWVCAELLLVIVTGAVVLIAVARSEARPADVVFQRLRWGLVRAALKREQQ